MTNYPILLIGPDRSGKSTIGKLLAEQLGLPFHHLWTFAKDYWKEIGHDDDHAREASEKGGNEGFYHYLQRFEAHAIERGIADHPDCIMELGAPTSVYNDPALLERVQKTLEPYENVILLQPSADIDESVRILKQRATILVDGMELNEHFIRHHSNHDLAKQVVYTEGKTPHETADEVLRRCRDIIPRDLDR